MVRSELRIASIHHYCHWNYLSGDIRRVGGFRRMGISASLSDLSILMLTILTGGKCHVVCSVVACDPECCPLKVHHLILMLCIY